MCKSKKITKLLTWLLCLVLITGVLSPAVDAVAAKKSVMSCEEESLFKEETFIVTKEAKARNVPYSKDYGYTIETLSPGDVIKSSTVVTNSHGNRWYKYETLDGSTAYFYSQNVKIHSECTFLSLESKGYPFVFCSECGKLKGVGDIYTIPYTGDEPEHAKLHICLTIFSLIPGVGNVGDVAEGLLYLYEGDTTSALISFGCVIPLGDIMKVVSVTSEATFIVAKNGLKYVDSVSKVSDGAVGFVLNNTGKVIKFASVASSKVLGKNMDDAYHLTRNKRYFKNTLDGDRSWAAHHIVAGNHPKAKAAREILAAAGIDINSIKNGVYLPMRAGLSEAAIHSGGHTGAYYEAVNTLLKDCTSPKEVEDTLDLIADLLMQNKFPW